jgi:hypothetical protein
MKPALILYFVDGPAPSPQDFVEASNMSAKVVFRNARAVPSEPHCLEICDGVAGVVPPIYAAKYPTAETAIKAQRDALAALAAKVGDRPAPTKPKTTAAKPAAPAAPAPAPAPAPAAPTPAAMTAPAPAAPAAPAPAPNAPAWQPNGG